MHSDKNVTKLLLELNSGREEIFDQLFTLVYDQMKEIARIEYSKEFNNITLQKTGLVHEAYLRLVDQLKVDFNDRKHFYAIAARCMRQILVDEARKRTADKRGGSSKDVTLLDHHNTRKSSIKNNLEIDKHLNELEVVDPRMAQVIEMRFFAGLKNADIAELLEVSKKTVSRDWTHAKGWLYNRIKKG